MHIDDMVEHADKFQVSKHQGLSCCFQMSRLVTVPRLGLLVPVLCTCKGLQLHAQTSPMQSSGFTPLILEILSNACSQISTSFTVKVKLGFVSHAHQPAFLLIAFA